MPTISQLSMSGRALTAASRGVLQNARKWLTTLVEPCGAHGGRFAKRPYSLHTEQAVFAGFYQILCTHIIYIRARQIAIATRLAHFLGAISNARVEDGIVNCSAVAFAEQVVLAPHNRWTLGTFLIIHAIAVGLYGSVEVTQLCPRNRSDPGAVHIEEVESMALRPVVQELPGVAFAAFARGKRPCSSRL